MSDISIPVVTIDGPSGTGKGTISQMVADELHWNMLDSGAIYRVLAFAAREKEIPSTDLPRLVDLAQRLDLRFQSSPGNESMVYLDNKEVTRQIRTEQCGQDASKIASIPEVRKALLERQRHFAEEPGLIADGRDMGTVVFPKADLKIFLYANDEERANRRYLQLQAKGINVSLAQVVEELRERDTRDAARSCAPLKAADDAILVDTTGLTIVQVFRYVLELIHNRLGLLTVR